MWKKMNKRYTNKKQTLRDVMTVFAIDMTDERFEKTFDDSHFEIFYLEDCGMTQHILLRKDGKIATIFGLYSYTVDPEQQEDAIRNHAQFQKDLLDKGFKVIHDPCIAQTHEWLVANGYVDQEQVERIYGEVGIDVFDCTTCENIRHKRQVRLK